MAIFTRRQLTTLEQKELFRTVDRKNQLILTEGYYVITKKSIRTPEEAKTEAEIGTGLEPGPKPVPNKVEVIATVNYSNGVAPYNPLYDEQTDAVFIYPNGYFGTNGTGEIILEDTQTTQNLIVEKLTQFVNSKLPQTS